MCMPRPSACGYPDATNTGVPPGTPLDQVNGPVDLKTPGMVYSGHEVHGEIFVQASNVTIEKVRVVSNSDYPIRTFDPSNPTGTVIRDVEIDMQGMEEGKGIAFDNYTAQRVWFHNGLDCAHAGRNVVITDSFCDLPRLSSGSAAHADGFQSDGGGNLVFRHNTIRNPNDQTSAILMSTNTAPIDTVVIDDNLMSGGGYTVYCGTNEGGVATHETYTDNVISREFFSRGGYYGPTTSCDRVAVAHGNIWDGSVVPPGGQGPGSPGGGARQWRLGLPLSVTQAKRVTRSALARQFRRNYTRRAVGLGLRCRRRSQSVVACSVSWIGPRTRTGGTTHRRRYSGTVVVTRVSTAKWRYTLRIRSRAGGCKCNRLIKRSGSL